MADGSWRVLTEGSSGSPQTPDLGRRQSGRSGPASRAAGRLTPQAVWSLVIAALALAACGTPLSPDGASPYTYTAPSSGTVVVSASSLAGGNEREFFFSPTGSTHADSSACETVSGNSPTQPGIAFRISDTNNGITAVTVSENVFGRTGYNDFNVHAWNTSQSPVFSLVSQVRITAMPSSPQPEPLNLCAELTGDVVRFVVWTSGPQPAWGDPTWGGSAILPGNVPTSGYTGFFAGHIPPGTSATYSNLTVDGAVNNPLGCCVSSLLASSTTAGEAPFAVAGRGRT